MGCLNDGDYPHWFGNIHLSGRCNRSCYFCIGQHMMDLDPFDVRDQWPLAGIDKFIQECVSRGITEVDVTGSNTDPLLYRHWAKLIDLLRAEIPDVTIGIRTNGVLPPPGFVALVDKASISMVSADPDINHQVMGGPPPNISWWTEIFPDLKVNIVLCPENLKDDDFWVTLAFLDGVGVTRVNLREPYGQPHLGDPLAWRMQPNMYVHGMPVYGIGGIAVTYWDVHYVEVSSVNLYSSGHVSLDYSVTKGHSPENGEVRDQSHFPRSGRIREQWIHPY